MDTPLIMTQIIERAEKYFPKKEVVSRTDGGIHTFTYAEIAERTRRLTSNLEKFGIQTGDRIGTLAQPSSAFRSLFCDSLSWCCPTYNQYASVSSTCFLYRQ